MITTVNFKFMQFIVILTLLAFMAAGCGHLNQNNEPAPATGAVTSVKTSSASPDKMNSLPADEGKNEALPSTI